MNPLVVFAFFPFIFFLYLLLVRKTSLLKSSFIIYFIFILFSIFIWQINAVYFYNSVIKGFFVALDIFFIITGAVFFLEILRHHHIIDRLILCLESISPDYRIQTIIPAWFLENFLEGIAGFGTPSTIVAPILVGLGLPPFSAVTIALLGNSISSSFGAVGTPIRIGFANLNLPGISLYTAAFNFIGLFIPAFMLWVVVKSRRRPLSDFYEMLPFSLFAGFTYVITSYITAFFSQELATIFGAVFSFIAVFLMLKSGTFAPAKNIPFPHEKITASKLATLSRVFLPYLVLITLLIIGKFVLGTVSFPIFASQVQKINLYNPGFAFIITALIFSFFWRLKSTVLFTILKNSIKRSLEPFMVIFSMSSMVQLLTLTGQNYSGFISILDTMLLAVKPLGVIFLAPLIGLFGSFITGSATVSNIMFGQLLYQAASETNSNPVITLSLQLAGASIGNMVALADVITAATVVNLKNQESNLVKRLLPFCFFLTIPMSLLGLFFLK